MFCDMIDQIIKSLPPEKQNKNGDDETIYIS